MIAFRICGENLHLITELNSGVEPKIEGEVTYFIYNTDPEGYNDLVTDSELKEKYNIRKVIMPITFIVDPR